jgi:peptidoglycan/xylan/chitin deacetylase (PgdA/CDA1 family)
MNRPLVCGLAGVVLGFACGRDKPAELGGGSPPASAEAGGTSGADAGGGGTSGADAGDGGTSPADASDSGTSPADAGLGGASPAPAGASALCVDDEPTLAAAIPNVTGPCTGTPDPSRPMGFGIPGVDDQLPASTAYLTFDDGPSDWTPEILDTLAAKGVHATFFINARNLKGPAGLDGPYTGPAGETGPFGDLVKREVDEGHVIGNHTVDHKDLAQISVADAAAELDLNEQLVNAALAKAGATPRPLTLVRPPWGSPWHHHAPVPADPAAAAAMTGRLVANRGLDVMWTIDSTDSREWAVGESYRRELGGVTTDTTVAYADKVARIQVAVLGDPTIAARSGAIILLHDTHNATRDALADLIDGLRAAGYTFGTVEELAQQRWGRPSLALTPGPALFAACVPQASWGCDVPADADAAHAVCGRLWRAYESAGGAAKLGAPTGAPVTDAVTGVTTQSFEQGVLALHPERVAPCTETMTASP